MAATQYTLTNVMRGMFALKLYSVLGQEFKLFWGLVMTANNLGFKNPIELVNQDAMVLAKVNNREMLRRRRNALTKARIYGNWILKYTPGNGWQTQCGKYEINYEFLLSAVGVWNGENTDLNGSLSTDVDRGVDRSVPRGVTDPLTEVLTTPRSDQRREEKNNNNATSNVSTKSQPETDDTLAVVGIEEGVQEIGEKILSRYRHQFNKDTKHSELRWHDLAMTALESVDGDKYRLIEALSRMPVVLEPKNGRAVTPAYAFNTCALFAKNRTWGLPKGTPAQPTEQERKAAQEKREKSQVERDEKERKRLEDWDRHQLEKEAMEAAKDAMKPEAREELRKLAEVEIDAMQAGASVVGIVRGTLVAAAENKILRERMDGEAEGVERELAKLEAMYAEAVATEDTDDNFPVVSKADYLKDLKTAIEELAE